MKIGIIGAGQLGQMLGYAARDLGVECRFIDPSDAPPAADCGEVIQRPFDDGDALAELAATCDVVTFEFENVPVEALRKIEDKVSVYPPANALRHAQDRLDEKRLFDQLDIPLAGYRTIDTHQDIVNAVEDLGLPLVIKTRRLGYDGKGQFVVRQDTDIDDAWKALGGASLGDIVIYPLSRNVHEHGILRTSCSPVDAPELAERAETYIRRLLGHLDYVGVMALELFVYGDDLLANEFAPRVHNSGHWTIEGARTSQFENHLRAVMNRPLGSTTNLGHAGMINLIGEIPDAARSLEQGELHTYGKSPRPGRKLGHITVTADTAAGRDELVDVISRSVTRSA
jgi:5-(carboxyamino)imidazole ribonucleotide synthase